MEQILAAIQAFIRSIVQDELRNQAAVVEPAKFKDQMKGFVEDNPDFLDKLIQDAILNDYGIRESIKEVAQTPDLDFEFKQMYSSATFSANVDARIERFAEGDALTEVVNNVIEEYDYSSHVEAVIDGYDFDDKIDGRIEQYDFSDILKGANLDGIAETVRNVINDGSFQFTI